jgi:hypothetical protein
MKSVLSILTLFVVLCASLGCGPGKVEEEDRAPVRLYDFDVNPDHERLTLSWRLQGSALISGYNVYISEQPAFEGTEPYNNAPFPGDTDPNDGVEYYNAEGLRNGVKFYVSVRVVYPDGSLSEPTPEETVVCGGRGTVALSVRYKSDEDGFSFDQNRSVRADADENDLYFYSKDGEDFLASPVRLNGFLRDTRLTVLPFKGTIDEVAEALEETPIAATEERVKVASGSWVLAQTASGGHALLHIDQLTGKEADRVVTISYAYSPLAGEILF